MPDFVPMDGESIMLRILTARNDGARVELSVIDDDNNHVKVRLVAANGDTIDETEFKHPEAAYLVRWIINREDY